jgi:hypothetical protein
VREYACTIEERQRAAAYNRERYWRDPDFRLHKINSWRSARGMEPYANANDIPLRGRRAA